MGTLIVNADDYGRTAAISRGIRFGHTHGIVTSTTVMMNLPGARTELEHALRETPGLGLGVHLNLTFGRPVSPAAEVPTLVDEQGVFHARDHLESNPHALDPRDVEREWAAQIEAFIAVAGPPDHLDSHHHTALFNRDTWQAALHLARQHDCALRAPLPEDLAASDLGNILPAVSAAFLTGEGMAMLAGSGLRTPDHFLVSFYGTGAIRSRLANLLDSPPDGVTELMCHPGYSSPELEQTSSYNRQRERELALLTEPGLAETLQAAGWRLASYSSAWNEPT